MCIVLWFDVLALSKSEMLFLKKKKKKSIILIQLQCGGVSKQQTYASAPHTDLTFKTT